MAELMNAQHAQGERYLFLLHISYGFEILRPLQKAIRERGGCVAWFLVDLELDHLGDDEFYLNTVQEVKAYNPRAIYVPGNWVPHFFPGVKVQVFHGLANDQTGKKGHYRIRGLFDLYCTHAPEITAEFVRLSEKYGTFKVSETGWPKLDPLFWNHQEKKVNKKPTILFASTFSPSLTGAPYLIETMRELIKDQRWQWILTLHPKSDPKVVQQYQDMASANVVFKDSGKGVLSLLKEADVMLCDTSSIALEFMFLEKPVVTFRTKVPGPHVLDVRDPSKLKAALDKALNRPPELMAAARAYVERLHAYRDGQSSQRILAATDSFIEHQLGSLKPKPLNLWRKWQMMRRLGYYRF